MKRIPTIITCVLLILALLSGCGGVNAVRSSADYLIKTVGAPQTGVSGGDWTVFALARSGTLPDGWRDAYFAALESALSAGGSIRSTDYSRMALTVRALGGNPEDASGHDLLTPLGDIEKTVVQGAAAISYAILALDEGSDLRGEYLERLLNYELPGGGFAPIGETETDADLTAIALQALASTGEDFGVQDNISAALNALSALQNPDGCFSNYGVPNAESTAQVIIALCSLGISPESDSRFVKDDSALSALMGFYVTGGGFSHTDGKTPNIIASEQGLCALAAISRLENGQAALYDFGGDGKGSVCSISVQCTELLGKLSMLDPAKHGLIPENGIIYENQNAAFESGESAFDLLRREAKSAGIHLEFTLTPVINTAYIEGIGNLYEFDCGESSGWLYSVNGEYPAFSCSEYKLEPGDVLVFEFVSSKREVAQ